MPTPVSGHGGSMVFDPSGTPVTFHVVRWTITKEGTHAEITDSSTSGIRKYKGITKGGRGTVEFVWDDTNIPDTDIAFDVNDEATIKLNLGSGGKFYQFASIVNSLNIVDDNIQDVIRGTLEFTINGAVTDPVT